MGKSLIAGYQDRITDGPINVRLGQKQKDKFREQVKNHVEKVVKTRIKNGACESEAEFFAGAMAVLCVVNEMHFGAEPDDLMDIVMPMWFIGPMSGRSIMEDWK
tara:strand:- start:2152 stop:2463 length:312 start_codon:yes stop_codon:yes gene_type:complete